MQNVINNAVNQRVVEAFEALKSQLRVRSKTEFSRIAGFVNTHWSEYESGKRRFNHSHLMALVNHFKDLSLRYLETGDGNIFKAFAEGTVHESGIEIDAHRAGLETSHDSAGKSVLTERTIDKAATEPDSKKSIKRISETIIDQLAGKLFPRVPAHTRIEYLQHVKNEQTTGNQVSPKDERIQIHQFFEVEGDDMSPALEQGDWVIASRLLDFTRLKSGGVYVIVTQGRIYIERVTIARQVSFSGQSKEVLIIESDNGTERPDVIAWEDVLEIWTFEAKLTGRV